MNREKKYIILIIGILFLFLFLILGIKFYKDINTNPIDKKTTELERQIADTAADISKYLDDGTISESDLLIDGYKERIRAEIEVYYDDKEIPENPLEEEDFLKNIQDEDLKKDLPKIKKNISFIKLKNNEYILKFLFSDGSSIVLPRIGQPYLE